MSQSAIELDEVPRTSCLVVLKQICRDLFVPNAVGAWQHRLTRCNAALAFRQHAARSRLLSYSRALAHWAPIKVVLYPPNPSWTPVTRLLLVKRPHRSLPSVAFRDSTRQEGYIFHKTTS